MTEVTGAITSLTGVVGGVWDLIISNPLGLLSVGAAGLTMGIGIFRKVTHK